VATNKLFAPPTQDELSTSAVQKKQVDLFAPPTESELFAPPTLEELRAPQLDSIQKEIQERGAFDRPAIIPQQITDEELSKIATKYGTSSEDLRSALPFLGGMPENVKASDVLKGAAGFAGEAVGLGVPQKLYRMAQDPKQEAALDELKELVSGRKSYVQYGAEFLAPGIGLAKVAKAAGGGLKGATAAGAVLGAAGGFGASKAGEEVSQTLMGAGTGAALGFGVQKLASRLSNKGQKVLTQTEQKAIQEVSADVEKLEQQTAKQMQENPGNALIEQYAIGTKNADNITFEDADRIIKAELGEEAQRAYLSQGSSEGKLLLSKLDENYIKQVGYNQAATERLARDIIEAEQSSYIQSVTGQKYTDSFEIKQAWKEQLRQGKQFVAEEFNKFRLGQKVDQAIEQRGLHDISPESKVGQIINKVSDARFALRTIDEKFKTSLEPTLDELSKNRNLMGTVRETHKKALDSLYDLAEKSGSLEAAKNGKLFNALDTGDFSKLTNNEKTVVEAFKKEYQDLYKFVTTGIQEKGIKGLDIPKVENYISRMSVPVPEAIAKVEMELRNAVTEANKILGTSYSNISQISNEQLTKLANQPAFKNLQSYLNWITGRPVQIQNGAQLNKAIQDSTRSESSIRMLDKVARGSMERDAKLEGIPDFIKEKNIFKALDRYSQDMLSSLYQRDSLSKMKFYADRLDKLNAKNEAEYVRNIVEDTWGVRKGTVAHYMRDARAQIARALDPKIDEAIKRGNTTRAFILNSIKGMEDLPGFFAKQIYPNVLGWRPVPIIQNVFSGIARTAPELGTKYGYTTYIRGLTYALKNWAQVSAEIKATGLIPESFTRTGQRAIADGIRASKAVDTNLRGLDAISQWGMALYEKSEQLNRASILGIAKMMTYDLTRGNKLAQEALTKFPSSVQRAITRAGNNPKQIESILATHLNGSTAFNYNRPSLYEFGRTMGPMFATFAKWPTAIAGEMASEIRTKGLPRGLARSAERYAAPLLAFAAIDYMLQEPIKEVAGEDRATAFIGKTGLTKAAPVSSLAGFVAGDIFTPPMIDTLMQDIVVPATKAEGVKLVRGLDRAAFMYAPGAGFIKFVTDFMPTAIFGERPEGGTQTERTVSGAEMLKSKLVK